MVVLSHKARVRLTVRCVGFVFFLATFVALAWVGSWSEDQEGLGFQSRDLAARSNNESYSKALSSGDKWQLVFYVIGILYMFLCLAIVCDEFFVPALMVMCAPDYLNLSDDVAGATLMAAGGSAPELFTSLIGTFQESDVGFGTIVGSAVFNVLFVIGMCAIFATEELTLTWWPLLRDCTCYILVLLVLYIFFGVNSSNEIEWYEALILFLMYLGYCTVMKFHTRIYVWLLKLRHGEHWEVAQETHLNLAFSNPSTFRAGIVSLLTSDREIAETAGIKAVVQLKGDLEQSFRKIDADHNNIIDFSETKKLLQEVSGSEPKDSEVEALMRAMQTSGVPRRQSVFAFAQVHPTTVPATLTPSELVVTFEQFSAWYVASEKRLEHEMERAFEMFDENKDGKIDNDELKKVIQLLRSLQGVGKSSLSVSDMSQMTKDAIKELDKNNDGIITKEEFFSWYRNSMFWTRARELQVQEEESADPLTISWPTSQTPLRGKIFFFLTLPIMLVLMFTLPDMRRSGSLCGVPFRKLCFLTFFLSICWIGFFSYMMVSWTEVVGDTFRIPQAVMGLTFLAAGTSVPDLLSSVIVAKQGKGDMAISSSIGSNIFDVAVGLPIPWLLYAFIKWENGKPKTVLVSSDSLEFSLLILMVMLVLVLVSIHVEKWRMTKSMGYFMFVFYGLFIAQDWINNFYCDKAYLSGCK